MPSSLYSRRIGHSTYPIPQKCTFEQPRLSKKDRLAALSIHPPQPRAERCYRASTKNSSRGPYRPADNQPVAKIRCRPASIVYYVWLSRRRWDVQSGRIRLHRGGLRFGRLRAAQPVDRGWQDVVLLLEAGGKDRDLWIWILAGYLKGDGVANPKVEIRALAHRVLTEGKRAIGVEFSQDGAIRQVRARREVLLAGGAINSPQLLQLSGIGPGALLRQHGIDVVHDLPGVGENLQDHCGGRIIYRCTANVWTMNEVYHNWLRRIHHGVQYVLSMKGALMTGAGNRGKTRGDSVQVGWPRHRMRSGR